MVNRGGLEASAGPAQGASRWWRARCFGLLPAVVLSLLMHALVLGFLQVPSERKPRRPLHETSLTARIVALRAAAPAAVAPAAVLPSTTSPAAAPLAPAPAEPRREPAPPNPRVAASAAVGAEAAFVPAEQLSDPPLARSNPFAGEGQPQLVSRRLRVKVWIDSDGTVQKATVAANEISLELAGELERALARTRFTPGRLDGKSVPSILEARLCFDGNGQLETGDARCLDVPSPAVPVPAPASAPAGDAASAPER